MKKTLQSFLLNENIIGTFLIAKEGINATISGDSKSTQKVINFFRKRKNFNDLEYKRSNSTRKPFKRLKIKIKDEIVTLGKNTCDPCKITGNFVDPKNWNKLITDSKVLLIDVRNAYETRIGSFAKSLNPNIKNFRDFPNFVRKNLDQKKNQKIAMYCTGGIRCEKASSYLLQLGFKKIYQLKGGILKYFEKNNNQSSRFRGECFVFDERVSLNKHLAKGRYEQCYACRMPISKHDIRSPKYKKGISCPSCFSKTSTKQKKRFGERQRQINFANLKNINHFSSQKK